VFDIFDLAFPKIVDPTIFVRDLSFVWRALREIFPLRGNFRRPSPTVHEVASHRRFCESRPPGLPVHEVAVRQSSVARQ